VRVVTQPNQGEIAAVNRGVAEVSADIVGIVNADDPVLPGLLDAVRTAFACDPDLAAVYPDWVRIDAEGREIVTVRTCEFDYGVLLAQHMCIPGPGAFFRRSMLPDEAVRDALAPGLSDYDFWLRYGRRGAKIARLPAVLATWRSHDAGTTFVAQGAGMARAKIAVVERLLDLPDLPQQVREMRDQALSAAYYHAALVGLRGSGVPALRYALLSYWLKPRWPRDVLPHQRRSLPHLVYAAAQPVSGALHRAVDPLLPPRYRRRAVLNQTFGLHEPAGR
jgi:glycosyltransferase involved in cell wall biosynthesis